MVFQIDDNARRRIAPLLAAVALAGCATVGPRIGRDELRSAREFYEVKSLRHNYAQVVRLRTVGERLLNTVPLGARPKNPRPSLGILLDDLTLTSGRVFGVPGIEPNPKVKGAQGRSPWRLKKACLIVGIIPESPAAHAGVEAGDLLLKVNDHPTASVGQAADALKKIKPDSTVTFLIEREGASFRREFIALVKPYPVSFRLSDEEAINAFASPGLITVSSAMLRFVVSDDELAVAMGHELAHLTCGHYAKKMGTYFIAGTIGMIAGVAVDVVLPGAGGVLSRVMSAGITAPFSQDFEREADYVGLKYAYLAGYRIEAGIAFWDRYATELPESLSRSFFSTHPTSPERILRLKKTIEELRKEKEKGDASLRDTSL